MEKHVCAFCNAGDCLHKEVWKTIEKVVDKDISKKLPQSVHRDLYTYPRFFVDNVEKVILRRNVFSYRKGVILVAAANRLRFTDKQLSCLSCTFWSNVTQKRGEFRFSPQFSLRLRVPRSGISPLKMSPGFRHSQNPPPLLFLGDIVSALCPPIPREKCPPTLCYAQSLPLLLFLRDIFSAPLPPAPFGSCRGLDSLHILQHSTVSNRNQITFEKTDRNRTTF